jgi:hypothetical protein
VKQSIAFGITRNLTDDSFVVVFWDTKVDRGQNLKPMMATMIKESTKRMSFVKTHYLCDGE